MERNSDRGTSTYRFFLEAFREEKQEKRKLEEQAAEKDKMEQENQILQGMVKKLTLEQGRAPVKHTQCDSIIKHLRQKIGFAIHQVAALTVVEEIADLQISPLDWEDTTWDPNETWDRNSWEDSPVAIIERFSTTTIWDPPTAAQQAVGQPGNVTGTQTTILTVPLPATDLKAMAEIWGSF